MKKIISIGLALITTVSVAWANSDKIRVFDWAGYDYDQLYPDYLKKYGGMPSYDFFGEEEEALQKMIAGYNGDISHPCGYAANVWFQAGILQPWDSKKLENIDELYPELLAQPGFKQNGELYIVPYDFGNTALIVAHDVHPSLTKSLQSFIDPSMKGKISLPDNMSDAFSLGFLATGVKDWSNVTTAEIKAAADWLRKAHKNVRFYWTEASNLIQGFKSEEIKMAWGWNEISTTLNAEGIENRMIRDTKEGSAVFVCGYVHLKSADPDNEDQIYDFINALTDKNASESLVTEFGYGHSNRLGMDALDANVLADNNLDNFEELAKNSLFQVPLPKKVRPIMIQEFEKIKAGF